MPRRSAQIGGSVNRRGAAVHAFMPSFAGELTNAQIAAVASYVIARFGNPEVSVDEVAVAELRAGGPTPVIVTVGPYVAAVGLLLLALILVRIAIRLGRGRRKSILTPKVSDETAAFTLPD